MKRLISMSALMMACVMLGGCATMTQSDRAFDQSLKKMRIDMVMDTWHVAAANGSFGAYFDRMSDNAVFLGTDASERWTKPEFMEYAREPFSDGHGWIYHPRDRFVAFSDDGKTAWIDEVLDHEKYGVLRGTGVLVFDGEYWKIAQYSLTFLVPNEKAELVIESIGGED